MITSRSTPRNVHVCGRGGAATVLQEHVRRWAPRALAPIRVVEDRLHEARKLWVDAKRRDCFLETTLRESLDALLRAHQVVAAEALVLSGGEFFGDVEGDPFAHRADAVRDRDEATILMRPAKRALLLKLLAYPRPRRNLPSRTTRASFKYPRGPRGGAATLPPRTSRAISNAAQAPRLPGRRGARPGGQGVGRRRGVPAARRGARRLGRGGGQRRLRDAARAVAGLAGQGRQRDADVPADAEEVKNGGL